MKPKQIKPSEPFQLHNTVYTYEVADDKIILTKVSSQPKKDLSADFEILWKIHSKGNKKTALQRFSIVINKVPIKELETKLTAYIQTNEFTYLKGLDVWLNPVKEHWNDPLVYKDGVKPADDNPMSKMVM